MQSIEIKVFGTPGIWIGGKKVALPFKKAEGILYFLAVERKTTRDALVNLFWCDVQDEVAKKNLRNALYMIRKAVGIELFSMPNRTYVELMGTLDITVDLRAFEQGDINAFSGDFLDGFLVKDAENFEQWAMQSREHYKEVYISRLNELIQHTEDERLVKEYCKRILMYDAFDEAVYRRLMKIYEKYNRFNKCIELYKALERTLTDELGISPDPQTQALYDEILQKKAEMMKDSKVEGDGPLFIGRKPELEELRLNHRTLHEDGAKSILFQGEAGVGKTALIQHFTSSLKDSCIILKAACYQEEAGFKLRPWDEIMRQVSKVLPELEDTEIPAGLKHMLGLIFPTFIDLGDNEAKATDGKLDFFKNQVLDKAMYELFDRIAERHDMILVFEDIHWMDSHSLSLIKHFVMNERNRRFYLVMSARYLTQQQDHTIGELKRSDLLRQMTIKGFSFEETKEVLKPYVALGKLTWDQLNRVYAETEGNALFLFELTNSLMDGTTQGEWSPKIKDVLQSRLIGLTQEARKVLNLLSVFFDYAPLDLLIALSDIHEMALADILEELIQQKLIKEVSDAGPELVVQFTHQKLRDFIYQELSHAKRRILCRRLAQIIEGSLSNTPRDRVQFSKLIYYFNQSGDRLFELKYKLSYLHDYLQVAHETFPMVYYSNMGGELNLGLSEEDLLKELRGIETLFEEVVPSKGQAKLLAGLKMEYAHIVGRYYIKTGEFKEGLKAIDRLIALAREYDDKAYLLKGYTQRIFYTINAHDLTQMKPFLDETLRISGQFPLEHHVILRLKGFYQLLIGRFEDAEKDISEAQRFFEAINQQGEYTLNIAACYYYLGESQRLQGHSETALKHFEKAIDLCKSKHFLGRLTIFYTHAGHAAFDMKDYERAQKFFEEATILYKTYDFRWGRSTACGFLGLLELMDGYYKEALTLFQSADVYAGRFNNSYEQGILRRIKAEACENLIRNRVRYVPILQYIGLDLNAYCDTTTLTYQIEDQGFQKDVLQKLAEISARQNGTKEVGKR